MTIEIFKLLGLTLLAFALSAAAVPLMKRLALRWGIVATPFGVSGRRAMTPALGGAAIVGATLVTLAVARALPGWMLLGAAGLFAVGLIDDAVTLRPLHKFMLQAALVMAVVILGPPHPGLTPWPLLSGAITAFWLLSTVNAFNLIDGLDGLSTGVGIAGALTITAIGLIHGDLPLACQGLALAGALAGFLLYNFHPASIFMGDGGALPLGLILGALALNAGGEAANSPLSYYAVPVLIMLMPLLDTAIVSVGRMATGGRVSRRGLDHSHHRLLALGLSLQRAVTVCWSVAALAGLCAVALALMPHRYVVLSVPFVIAMFGPAGLFMIDLTFDSSGPGAASGYLQGLARMILAFSFKRRLIEATLDVVSIAAAYFGAFLIRFDFAVDERRLHVILNSLPWVIAVAFAGFFTAGIYRGIWRYAGFADVIRFATGAVLAALLVVVASVFLPIAMSGSIAVLFVILLMNLLVASRLSFRALHRALALLATPSERILIVGAGAAAEAAARFLCAQRHQSLHLIGLVEDERFTRGKFVHGYEVLGTLDDCENIYADTPFNQILIAGQSLARERMALLWAFAGRHNIGVRGFSLQSSEMGARMRAPAAFAGDNVPAVGHAVVSPGLR